MHEDIKWLFGLIIIFGLFWFVSMFSKTPTEQQNTQTEQNQFYESNNQYTYGSTPGYGTVKPSPTDEIGQSIKNASIKAEEIKAKLADIERAKNTSPLNGKLSLSNVSRGSSTSAGEFAIVRANPNNTEKILITGLRLQSPVSGQGANIPKGVALYFQNQVNKEEPIYLAPGETAYIITGRSPLGSSFRLNKCTGFFNQYQNFNPGIPSRCPNPNESDLPNNGTIYNDACRNYINSVPGCRVITDTPANISPECKRYVTEELTYSKCVNKYKNGSDFYDPEWRVYLGRDDALWKSSREIVQLVDQNGKIIDMVNY